MLKYLPLIAVFLLGAIALYLGITGKDVYTAPFQNAPLPQPFGRIMCFVVAGWAICFLVIALR